MSKHAVGRDVFCPAAALSEADIVARMLKNPVMTAAERRRSAAVAERIIRDMRRDDTLVHRLMQAYALNSREGIALMSLAEAMLRVPDAATRDALINDKIPGRDWLSGGASGLAHSAGVALSAIGGILSREHTDALSAAAGRLGMPMIRRAVLSAMKLFGGQFVLAETIGAALTRARRAEKNDDTLYSFDMLGEAARDEGAAARYFDAYERAIRRVSALAAAGAARFNHGVSVKLSALHPRYQTRQRAAVTTQLLPRILRLAKIAKDGNVPLTLDAEEMARLDLSLDITAALMRDKALAGWDGLGVVVQAYGLRALAVIDALAALARDGGHVLAVRLVKGAYWDGEIKVAQQKGAAAFPVFTRKAHTDLAYLHCAEALLKAGAAVYPQFASHNAATLAAVQIIAARGGGDYEVQRLHGMGASIHDEFKKKFNRRCRVYAPVGEHDDLLAYLVRRLLENGANSSFIHHLRAEAADIKMLVAHPHDDILADGGGKSAAIRSGATLFLPNRNNSRGADLDDPRVLAALDVARSPYKNKQYVDGGGAVNVNPAIPEDRLHTPAAATDDDVRDAFAAASASAWRHSAAAARADILDDIAALYEDNAAELFALLAREAGKTIDDAVDELREAADFCRYYAAELRCLPQPPQPRGVVLAISPWNFPLAIFTGQIVAALAAGNRVVAKPAEQTPLTALLAVRLMRRAGVPRDALRLLYGDETVGARLTAAGVADMVVFTGSTAAARHIHRSIAASAKPAAPLLAETGGLNAMIVDSTALLERATDDIIMSAFHSAGQRCSALRLLYAQQDIADKLLAMVRGAAACLTVGDPWRTDTDIGPVIDAAAARDIESYVAARHDRVLWRAAAGGGAPTIIGVDSIADMEREVFGPVLHFTAYPAARLDDVLREINDSGYGLTFGLHSRIEERQRHIANVVHAGNVYINRNQIGAVVGSQPFGGRGLSGTGPKAGGPLYLGAFTRNCAPRWDAPPQQLLPGVDGEENCYRRDGRGRVLILAATAAAAAAMRNVAVQAGNSPQQVDSLSDDLSDVEAVMADAADIGAIRRRLAAWRGGIIPLITDAGGHAWLVREKHVSTDTTAVGGNVALLSMAARQ